MGQVVSKVFQFRFGSIERFDGFIVVLKVTQFQFRFGSIESFMQVLRTGKEKIFQFRFGSIERSQNKIILMHLLYFNSALVRLRAAGRVDRSGY